MKLNMTITNGYPEAHLLGTPAEIRNNIFLEVAKDHAFNVKVEPAIYDVAKMHSRKHKLFAAMRVCKQMTKEMRPLFFSNNTFSFKTETYGACGGVARTAPVRGLPAESYGHYNKSGNLGFRFYVSLPHVQVRKMMRHVHLTVMGPLYCVIIDELHSPTVDWIYPVRVFKEMGFVRLESLCITVQHCLEESALGDLVKMVQNELDQVGFEIPHVEVRLASSFEKDRELLRGPWIKEAGQWMQES